MSGSGSTTQHQPLPTPGAAPEPPPLPLRRWLPHAIGLYLAGTVVLFAPALPAFRHAPVGIACHHPYDVAWFYQATARALFTWPPSLHSELLDYPRGLDLLAQWADAGSAILAAPLTHLVGPFLSYNLEVSALVVLAGLSACWLTLILTRDRVAGWVAGLLYMAMDPLQFAIAWGEDDVAEVWLIAVALGLLWRTLDGRARGGLLVGAFIGTVGWFNSYYLYMSTLCAAILLGAAALRRRGPALITLGWYAAAMGAAMVPILGPRFLLARAATRVEGRSWSSHVLTSLEDFTRANPSFMPSSALDLSGLLNPLSQHRWSDPALVEGFSYLGLVALALAVLGLLRARVRRRRSLALLGGLGVLIGLGPYLQWENAIRYWPGTSVPVVLPGGPLWELLPLTYRMSHPFRFAILGYLAVAVLAGAGISHLASRLPARRHARRLLVLGLAAACIAERALVSPAVRPLGAGSFSVSESFSSLPEVPGRPAVLHLPFPPQRTEFLDMEPFRYHRVAQLLGHHRPLAFPAAWTLADQDEPRDAVARQLRDLAARGVGLVLVDHGFMAVDPPYHPVPFIWPAAIEQVVGPSLQRNLQRCLTPLRAGDLDIYVLAGESLCGSGVPAAGAAPGEAGAPEEGPAPSRQPSAPRVPGDAPTQGLGHHGMPRR
ncbi:MAG: hypothetical protein ABIO70_22745 [Pseudomonadota bacterium]